METKGRKSNKTKKKKRRQSLRRRKETKKRKERRQRREERSAKGEVERIGEAEMKRGEGETPQVASIKKITEREGEKEGRRQEAETRTVRLGADYRVKPPRRAGSNLQSKPEPEPSPDSGYFRLQLLETLSLLLQTTAGLQSLTESTCPCTSPK
ncbi:hypothetical protein ABVT39_000171 [Epinephelus coioides]